MNMPTKKLPEQTGNSCAAHCTVIAVAELLDVQYLLSKGYAEEILWPSIKFKTNGNPVIDSLAQADNSDPRLIVSETELRWAAAKATLKCDETQKTDALNYITDPTQQLGLAGLFNMMKGSGSVATITPEEGVYYNSSYLMIQGSTAATGKFEGMHNILVTKQGGQTYYYNPNESTPNWSVAADWKKLDNQNGGRYSYVFTGVCVEMRRK